MSRMARGAARVTAVVLLAGLVSGCAGARQDTQGINDPYEADNRAMHEFNKKIDSALFKDASLPDPVLRPLVNVGGNLGLPSKIVNSLLQGRLEPAGQNFFRLVLNSTLGVAGIFDVAQSFGLPEVDTDFGETLYVWGMGEGPYMELPLLGPSTERDALGRVVDIALDPVGLALSGHDARVATAFTLGSKVGDRLRFGGVIDSVLYESADSYAQSRLLYLQSRRHQLSGQEKNDADAFDPYAE
ncbi:MAG: VacJ family lipoprotein [Paracoccaceae bacterium]|jgi:phospholipid-binding lipoprotein MlaA|nr:VacJ family lipoprotein [Paracoccaceae bacterium]